MRRLRALLVACVAGLALSIPAVAADDDAAPPSVWQYTLVSNVMKTKHDTVKNSISNVR
jgi:hypothetical protein